MSTAGPFYLGGASQSLNRRRRADVYIEHGPIESKWPTPAKKKALPCLKCSRVVGDEATDYLGQRPWGRLG